MKSMRALPQPDFHWSLLQFSLFISLLTLLVLSSVIIMHYSSHLEMFIQRPVYMEKGQQKQSGKEKPVKRKADMH